MRLDGRDAQTFCFVYEPAPGHSVIMSSFASLLVANAKATPENVVPCARRELLAGGSHGQCEACSCAGTHEINANDQLGLAAAVPLDLGGISRATILLLSPKAARRRLLGRTRRIAGGRVARGTAHRWRTAGHLTVRRVARDGGSRVDGGRASNHLGGRGAVRAWLG